MTNLDPTKLILKAGDFPNQRWYEYLCQILQSLRVVSFQGSDIQVSPGFHGTEIHPTRPINRRLMARTTEGAIPAASSDGHWGGILVTLYVDKFDSDGFFSVLGETADKVYCYNKATETSVPADTRIWVVESAGIYYCDGLVCS